MMVRQVAQSRRLPPKALPARLPFPGRISDLAAVKRLLDGTQTVTVYKPLKLIASEAAKLTVQLVKGEKPAFTSKINNGTKDVDTLLLTPTAVTKEKYRHLCEGWVLHQGTDRPEVNERTAPGHQPVPGPSSIPRVR